MVWLFLISAIFIIILFYVLFAPFVLEINSGLSIYSFRFHRIVTIDFIPETFTMKLKILFWKRNINLNAPEVSGKEKVKPGVSKKRPKRKIGLRRILNVLRSFHIKKFEMSVDTGNVELNGILYPVIYALGIALKKNVSINFLNENYLILEIRNNLARMIRAYYFNKQFK